jgi:hypothetical protein
VRSGDCSQRSGGSVCGEFEVEVHLRAVPRELALDAAVPSSLA